MRTPESPESFLKRHWLPLVVFVVYVVFLVFRYSWPTSDSADYLHAAFKVLDRVHDASGMRKLQAFFTTRHWKSVFYSHILALFVSFNYSLQIGVLAFQCFVIGIFIGYLWLYLDVVLARKRFKGLCLVLVLLTVHYLELSQTVYPEFFLMASCLACFFHLERSNGLKDRSHSVAFAFFILLSLMIRPDLSTVALAPAVALSVKREKWGLKNFGLYVLTPVSVACLWYVPFLDALLNWIVECSVGGLAQRTGLGFQTHGFHMVHLILSQLFNKSYSLWGLAFFGLLLIKIRKKELWTPLEILLLSTAFILPILALFTNSGDARYFVFPALCFQIFVFHSLEKTFPPVLSDSILVLFIISATYLAVRVHSLPRVQPLPSELFVQKLAEQIDPGRSVHVYGISLEGEAHRRPDVAQIKLAAKLHKAKWIMDLGEHMWLRYAKIYKKGSIAQKSYLYLGPLDGKKEDLFQAKSSELALSIIKSPPNEARVFTINGSQYMVLPLRAILNSLPNEPSDI